MAEEQEQAKPDGEAPKGKSKMMLIIVALNVVVLGGVGAFVAFGTGGGETAEAAEQEPEMPELTEPPVTVSMQPLVVNLYEPGGGRYLKLVVELEVPGEQGKEIVESSTPMLRHEILTYLSGLTFADTQGAEKKEAIRKEMIKRTNDVLRRDVVRNLYFTEFIIQ